MLFVYCEGNEGDHTEALFVSRVLNPYLESQGCPHAIPIPSHGIRPFSRVRSDLNRLLRNPHARVTTLIDYYGTPADYPGMPHRPSAGGNRSAVYDDVARLETELSTSIDSPRFIPYYAVHEFEALVFADPTEVARQYHETDGGSVRLKAEQMLAKAAGNPELINDSRDTSPSHRLADLWSPRHYQKTIDGIEIVSRTPFARLRTLCPHFNSWVSQLLSIP